MFLKEKKKSGPSILKLKWAPHFSGYLFKKSKEDTYRDGISSGVTNTQNLFDES